MSQIHMHGYQFATEAQWNTCLFAGADRGSREARASLRPFAPYGGPSARFKTQGGYAPTVTASGEALWRDDHGHLQRLAYGDDRQHAVMAPIGVTNATRLVATSSLLWTAGGIDGGSQAFDLETLSRVLVIDYSNSHIVDIAGDGRDGLFALLERNDVWEITHSDCVGRIKSSFTLQGIPVPSALIYLQHVDRLVVLSDQGAKLHWLIPDSGRATFRISFSTIRPCFTITALGCDGRARLVVAGTDGAAFGGLHRVLTLDAEGNLLGDLVLEAEPTGVTANRHHLLVTTSDGLLQFDTNQSGSQNASDVRATLVTPMLQSPSTEGLRRWLRIEASVDLPLGSTLQISYASTDEHEVRYEAQRLATETAIPAGHRLQLLRDHLGPWQTISFHGSNAAQADESIPLSAPLFDIRERYLWVSITLIASPGGALPVLSKLAVLYPGRTLMENLPGLYQRAEAQPGNFLRSLVGVLETTTQGLDSRIADMGRKIHPQTAPGLWLDFIARWLGLPWDDALSLQQKRRIVLRAADIARGRGTRLGLEALLESLMPDKPRRFRVVDTTADFGLATVGSDTCAGSRLPALLGGLPSTASELNNKAILGHARLPCPGNDNETARLVGHIRVDVSADADEQARWQPWLRPLIVDMVPATTHVHLRWLSATVFRQNLQLGEGLELEAAPTSYLGTGAVLGLAQLPGQRGLLLSDPAADLDSPLL